jgi:hypothetical protein
MGWERLRQWFGLHPDRGTCRCGHSRAAHEHLRRGTDCALCPVTACNRYRAA